MMDFLTTLQSLYHSKKVNFPVTGPVVAQRVGRVIALLFHDRGTRRRWVVSSMLPPLFTPGKDPVPIVQEAGWAPGLVWTGRKSRSTGIRSPDCPLYHSKIHKSYLISCSNLMPHFFITFITFPYMFRETLCSSSGGFIVYIQHLVLLCHSS